jgi:hypothetical protein
MVGLKQPPGAAPGPFLEPAVDRRGGQLDDDPRADEARAGRAVPAHPGSGVVAARVGVAVAEGACRPVVGAPPGAPLVLPPSPSTPQRDGHSKQELRPGSCHRSASPPGQKPGGSRAWGHWAAVSPAQRVSVLPVGPRGGVVGSEAGSWPAWSFGSFGSFGGPLRARVGTPAGEPGLGLQARL